MTANYNDQHQSKFTLAETEPSTHDSTQLIDVVNPVLSPPGVVRINAGQIFDRQPLPCCD